MEIFSLIITVLIAIFTTVMPFALIAALIIAIVAHFEKDATKKAKLLKWAKWVFIGPILGMLLILVLWGLVSILKHNY